ncbi:hypothetical protein F4780DRAFT_738603 [Xylariomycetidae sp. FL0641]|nr:hypothetical protein F4780DRAFT_738603 [Xylariomycetidae sp. FL0641]
MSSMLNTLYQRDRQGYSFGAVLSLCPVLWAVTFVTGMLAARHLPGYMKMAGSNSRAISAACHVLVPIVQGEEESEVSGLEGRTELEKREILSQSEIKWGEVGDTEAWSARFPNFGKPVGHLSFGIEGAVRPPVQGHYYA